jgi:hypothetical protein
MGLGKRSARSNAGLLSAHIFQASCAVMLAVIADFSYGAEQMLDLSR